MRGGEREEVFWGGVVVLGVVLLIRGGVDGLGGVVLRAI